MSQSCSLMDTSSDQRTTFRAKSTTKRQKQFVFTCMSYTSTQLTEPLHHSGCIGYTCAIKQISNRVIKCIFSLMWMFIQNMIYATTVHQPLNYHFQYQQ